METRTIEGYKLRPGMKVKCKICGEPIDDAKIAFTAKNTYICQDHVSGAGIPDKLGYKHSWCITAGMKVNHITDFEIQEDTYEIF